MRANISKVIELFKDVDNVRVITNCWCHSFELLSPCRRYSIILQRRDELTQGGWPNHRFMIILSDKRNGDNIQVDASQGEIAGAMDDIMDNLHIVKRAEIIDRNFGIFQHD